MARKERPTNTTETTNTTPVGATLVLDADFDLAPEATQRKGGVGRQARFPEIDAIQVGGKILFPNVTLDVVKRAVQIVEKKNSTVDGTKVHRGKEIARRVKSKEFTVAVLSAAQKAKLPAEFVRAHFESPEAFASGTIVGVWRTA